jgi:hypothetical protein
MRTVPFLTVLVGAVCACSAKGAPPVPAPISAQNQDSGADAGPTLTLSIDPSLDQDGDQPKAATISAADLLDTHGSAVVHGTIDGNSALFDLAGLNPGDYFIEVNGDADDLLPTRIDDPASDLEQRVGTALRQSFIGPAADPGYRIHTYSPGQNKPPIVAFSDGSSLTGEYAYFVCWLGAPKIEVRVLGTANLLSTYLPKPTHPSNDAPFDSWMINTPNADHHGDAFNADGGASACSSCHLQYSTKPSSYGDVTPSSSWCFHCHNGPGGDLAGFVDPTR